jgi:hypothetical protein
MHCRRRHTGEDLVRSRQIELSDIRKKDQADGHGRHADNLILLIIRPIQLPSPRQLLMESLLLSATGAAVGLVIAAYASKLLVRQLSTPANVVFLDVSIDGSVLAFTAGVTAMTTMQFGTLPALRAARLTPMAALKERARSVAEHAQAGPAGSLVVVQGRYQWPSWSRLGCSFDVVPTN